MLNSPEAVKAVKGNSLPVYRGRDYTNTRLENWLVLGPISCERVSGQRNYRTKWFCQCSCGSAPQWVTKESLTKGLSRGCLGCAGSRNSGTSNGNWKGFGEIPGEAFNKVRAGAKSRGIPLEVTIEELHTQWLSQDRKCALTGLPLVMGDTASLDRIDSNKSYRADNIQWVHKVANIMKNDFSEEVFIDMCKRVSNFRKLGE